MIAEQLIRSGQAFMQGMSSPKLLLKLVSDSDNDKAKNFWQHVLIVEVDPKTQQILVHQPQSWGSWLKPEGSKKDIFVPDQRISMAPIFLPSGGNPLHAQGFYGLPIYPIYEKHWLAFAKNPKGVCDFLKPRLKKTAHIDLSELLIEQICSQIHAVAKAFKGDDKALGVMVIGIVEENGAFKFLLNNTDISLSPSRLLPNYNIYANVELMLERISEAKAKEGAGKGQLKEGICAFTGQRGSVISGYNKAWPWFTTTWKAPFPNTFGDSDHVHRMAFSPEAYRYLTVGAAIFGKLTKELDYNLNKQLFAPVDSAVGRDNAAKGQAKSKVFGSLIVTPLLDQTNLTKEIKENFASGLRRRIDAGKGSRGAKQFLSNLLGYEDTLSLPIDDVFGCEDDLPTNLFTDEFRLTSVYFSGDLSRADIHLQAVIEDIVPSVLKSVNELLEQTSDWSSQFYSDNQDWLRQHMKSLPYLLVQAYGPGFLWQSLARVLHGEALSWQPVVRGIAHRCRELSHSLKNNHLELGNEAILYATFRYFYMLYHQTFSLERRTMRPWQTLVENISNTPLQDIQFQDVEELGFSAGCLIRRFSAQYYMAADEKDYLQHRVMTFGSDLTPDVIYRRALGKLPEYAARVDAHLNDDFRQRLGIWLSSYPAMKDKVKKNSDEFMAAFWAGYMLGKVES